MNMDAEQKAISLLNNNIKLTYNCGDSGQSCAMKCPLGVCKSALHDAKRISYAMIDEIINSHKAVRIATEISARDVSMIKFWSAVKIKIEKI